jgi:uncharacterized protein YggE
MRRAAAFVLALLPLTLATLGPPRPAVAQEVGPGIRVQGQGVVAARPDVATVTLGVSVRRPSAGEAFDRAAEQTANLMTVLRAGGVPDSDIQTRQLTLTPEFGRAPEGAPPPVVAWRATHLLAVRLRDFSRIGRLIDTAVQALGDEALVQGVGFSIEDTGQLAARARAAAMADARAKAEDLAARAGVQLGRVLAIEEVSAPAPTPQRVAAPAPVAGQVSAIEIAPGEQTITVLVRVHYAIE